MLCDALEMSRSAYYKWLKAGVSARQQKRQELLERIVEIFRESRETYGAPRIYKQLRTEGYTCTRRTVEELMRKHEIAPNRRRKYKSTTDSNHKLPIAPNVLDRQFTTAEADEAWVSDITYIETGQGWLYLCVFIDLYSRMVVGWSMSDRMTADLVLNAFDMGIQKQQRAPIVAHSDRGSQYASRVYVSLLEEHGCIQSMSRKANCWDNAVAESFFGILKSELIHRETFETRIQACTAIFDYIETFYNTRRLHSALNYITPWEKGQKGKQAA